MLSPPIPEVVAVSGCRWPVADKLHEPTVARVAIDEKRVTSFSNNRTCVVEFCNFARDPFLRCLYKLIILDLSFWSLFSSVSVSEILMPPTKMLWFTNAECLKTLLCCSLWNASFLVQRINRSFGICKQAIGCGSVGCLFSNALWRRWELMSPMVIDIDAISSLISCKSIGTQLDGFMKLHFLSKPIYTCKFPRFSYSLRKLCRLPNIFLILNGYGYQICCDQPYIFYQSKAMIFSQWCSDKREIIVYSQSMPASLPNQSEHPIFPEIRLVCDVAMWVYVLHFCGLSVDRIVDIQWPLQSFS